jgi:SAM-dependent methyltransferase
VNEQHNIEIHQNRAAWKKKPLLQRAYLDFYRLIATKLNPAAHGMTVELGSGMGNIKKVIPDCITTDMFPNPWLDRQVNAYQLSFPDKSLANLILFDVWHHLEFPGTALNEFHRVLATNGRLILFEPAMGLLGRMVYSLAHHEPVALRQPIRWLAPPDFVTSEPPYFAAQSRADRIFVRGEHRDKLASWQIIEVRSLAAFAYLASGGFSKPQLCPTWLYTVLTRFDSLLSRLPSLFAVRLIAVLEKRTD